MNNQHISSESDSDSDENKPVLMKPVFISKRQREIFQKEDVESKVSFQEIRTNEREHNIKVHKQIIDDHLNDTVRVIKAEEQENDSDWDLPDDADELINTHIAKKEWEIRELKRIKRDFEENAQKNKELAEMQRRRTMDNEALQAENSKLGIGVKQERAKYLFLQKYYHQGAFFQGEDEELSKRDFNVAVGEDLFDKEAAPRVLQKRRGNFGKKGQSKYTHLTQEDTTDFNPAYKRDEKVQELLFSKMAGLKSKDFIGTSVTKRLKT